MFFLLFPLRTIKRIAQLGVLPRNKMAEGRLLFPARRRINLHRIILHAWVAYDWNFAINKKNQSGMSHYLSYGHLYKWLLLYCCSHPRLVHVWTRRGPRLTYIHLSIHIHTYIHTTDHVTPQSVATNLEFFVKNTLYGNGWNTHIF